MQVVDIREGKAVVLSKSCLDSELLEETGWFARDRKMHRRPPYLS